MEQEQEIHNPEVVEEPKEVARPLQPFSVTDLAALDQGIMIMERKLQIIKTLRAASIALTFPQDWVLFKAEDRITGYLQDAGCDRVKDMWGIQIEKIGDLEKIEDPADEQGVFGYSITGEGYSKVTGQAVERMTGIRYSDEDFIISRKLKPIKLDAEVKKAARANLDGSILRELAGLKSVPIEELDQVWSGSWKKSDKCPRGRGFGTADERAGGASEKSGVAPEDVPKCGICKDTPPLVFRPARGDRAAFWGCRQYASHPNDKVFVDHARLLKDIEKRKSGAAKREPGDENG